MIADRDIEKQLSHVLTSTDLGFLGKKYEGKVRDSYIAGDRRYLITTDRLSCFDVVVTAIPFKGQVLNQLAVHWFKLAENIVPNHLLDLPDENVMVVKNCEILPVEVVVRGYLAGSGWRDYEAGRPISGIKLPAGMKAFQKLPEVLLTPSTKAERGTHDEPISEAEIVRRGIVDAKIWNEVREKALALFALGQQEADRRGLILVDTKYEFGLRDGKLLLADEIHTLYSSRYWIKQSYSDRLARNESPEMLDKEPTRQWLLSVGFKGDGPIPEFTAQHRIEIAKHYMGSYEKITGKTFEGQVGAVEERIRARLRL